MLGWWLGGRTARQAAREQREWHERQTVREREELAAAQLNDALIEIGKSTHRSR